MPTPLLGRLFGRKPKIDPSIARAQRLVQQILATFSIPGSIHLYTLQQQARKSHGTVVSDRHRYILVVRVGRFMPPDVLTELQFYLKRKICERPSIALKPDEFSVNVVLKQSLPGASTQRVVSSQRIAALTSPLRAPAKS